MNPTLRSTLSLGGPIAIILLALLISPLGGKALTSMASFGLINLILVLGLYIFVGNTGIVSFGHIAFVAVGAYVGALTSMTPGTKAMLLPDLPDVLTEISLPFWASVLLAAAAASLLALVLGVPLMRLHGLAAGIGTLAMLVIVRDVIRNWKSVTGGAGTLNGIPIQASLPGLAAVAIIAVVIAYLFQLSRRGRLGRATREDRIAAEALGVNVFRERLVSFIVSAAVAGAGGAMYAAQLGAIASDTFYLQLTFLVLAMLVIGGMTSIWGAVIGTLTVTVIQEGLRTLQNLPALSGLPSGTSLVLVGIALLVVLIFLPQGITGGREFGDLRMFQRRVRGVVDTSRSAESAPLDRARSHR